MRNLFEKLPKNLRDKLAGMELLVLDFDGTLTDNKVFVSQEGKESVRADRGDGLGLELLRENTDVDVLILSKETNPVTVARAEKLKIKCSYGIKNKEENFKDEVSSRGILFKNTCFVGNDLNDIECIKMAGIGIVVNDAYEQVKEVADYITSRKGGDGAVREVCELIMYAKKSHPNP